MAWHAVPLLAFAIAAPFVAGLLIWFAAEPQSLAPHWFEPGDNREVTARIIAGGIGASLVSWLYAFVRRAFADAEFSCTEDIALTRADAPELFATLDRLCTAMGSAPIDLVAVPLCSTAYAMQENGGERRRVLGFGLPLLMLLSRDRALAVMAHEIAHFAEDDVGALRYAHRLCFASEESDDDEEEELELAEVLAFVFEPVAMLLSIPMRRALARSSRASELCADAFSALAIDRDVAVDALILTHILDAEADKAAWAPIEHAFEYGLDLPFQLVEAMPARLRETYDRSRLEAALRREGNRSTRLEDTHPDLAARVAALGGALRLPAIDPNDRAFEALLGRSARSIAERAESSWRGRIETKLSERREDVRRTADLLQQAIAAVDDAVDPAEAAEIVALLAERAMPWRDARPLLEEIAARFTIPEGRGHSDPLPAPTARILLLADDLRNDDPESLAAAIFMLHECPMMAGDIYAALYELEHDLASDDPDREDGAACRRAILEDPDMHTRIRTAIDRYEVQLFGTERPMRHSRGYGPHGLAPWHEAMIVDEIARACAKRGMTFRQARLVRHLDPFAGAPCFSLLIDADIDPELEFDEDLFALHGLKDRICLPGAHEHKVSLDGYREKGFPDLDDVEPLRGSPLRPEPDALAA